MISDEGPAVDKHKRLATTLKSRRVAMNLSISALAKTTGLAKSNLSRLEAGEGNPSLETLWALSAALDINVRDLIDPHPKTARVSRADAQYDAQAEAAEFGITSLSPSPPGAARDLYRATFTPGRPRKSAPHAKGTIEHVILITGSAKIGPDAAQEILMPGDHMMFAADQAHSYEALEPGTTAIIIMETQ